ncbi:MAG TPA: phage terminase small subunit P27 family [Vulgatibacter sp.]
MRGRPRKPTALHVIDGTARPDRANRREPKPKVAEPLCPTHLDEIAKSKWRELAPQLVRLGVLTRIDGDALAIYCQAYSRWAAAEDDVKANGITYTTANGMVRQNPAVGISSAATVTMATYGGKLGLNPADRAKLHGSGEDEEEEDLLD